MNIHASTRALAGVMQTIPKLIKKNKKSLIIYFKKNYEMLSLAV
jgi:hypothetical protein